MGHMHICICVLSILAQFPAAESPLALVCSVNLSHYSSCKLCTTHIRTDHMILVIVIGYLLHSTYMLPRQSLLQMKLCILSRYLPYTT